MTMQEFFEVTLANVLRVVPCSCPVVMRDNGEKALGSTFFDADMRPVEIVIDDYFVENNWLAASGSVVGKALVELAGDTLIGTICHEIAHLTHFRHGKKHTRLTQEYIARLGVTEEIK